MNRYNLILEDDCLISDVAALLNALKKSTKLTGHCACVDKFGNTFFVKKNKNSYTIYGMLANRKKAKNK